MTKLDLITGFLGSGKTTFIKKYVSYLKNSGQNVCIIENDFGAINVDLMLVSNLGVDIEMISGGCDSNCYKRRFKTKLISLIHKHYDRIIIEPSGLFDSDLFFDTLYEDEIINDYTIGNVFCMYDISTHNLNRDEMYLFVSESANASKIIVSKRDNKNIEVNLDYINYMHSLFNSNRLFSISDILYTDSLDFSTILNLGYKLSDHIKLNVIDNNNFDSIYILDKDITLDFINSIKNKLFDNSLGQVLRVKGFIYDKDWIEINLTKNEEEISKINNGQKVIIIIGYNLDKDKINYLFNMQNN